MSVKAENVELKNHLNSVIKELNAITELLNNKYGDLIETTYELDIWVFYWTYVLIRITAEDK